MIPTLGTAEKGTLIAALLSVILSACAQQRTPSDLDIMVDDEQVQAIEIARHDPSVAHYIALPQRGRPSWDVHSDLIGYSERDRGSMYAFRKQYCPDQYVVGPIIISRQHVDVRDVPEVMVDLHTHRIFRQRSDDGFVKPNALPTPCMDGQQPRPSRIAP